MRHLSHLAAAAALCVMLITTAAGQADSLRPPPANIVYYLFATNAAATGAAAPRYGLIGGQAGRPWSYTDAQGRAQTFPAGPPRPVAGPPTAAEAALRGLAGVTAPAITAHAGDLIEVRFKNLGGAANPTSDAALALEWQGGISAGAAATSTAPILALPAVEGQPASGNVLVYRLRAPQAGAYVYTLTAPNPAGHDMSSMAGMSGMSGMSSMAGMMGMSSMSSMAGMMGMDAMPASCPMARVDGKASMISLTGLTAEMGSGRMCPMQGMGAACPCQCGMMMGGGQMAGMDMAMSVTAPLVSGAVMIAALDDAGIRAAIRETGAIASALVGGGLPAALRRSAAEGAPETDRVLAVQAQAPFQILTPAYLPAGFDRAQAQVRAAGEDAQAVVEIVYRARGSAVFLTEWLPGSAEGETLVGAAPVETKWGAGRLLAAADGRSVTLWADNGLLRLSVTSAGDRVLASEDLLAIVNTLGPPTNQQTTTYGDKPAIRPAPSATPAPARLNAEGMQEVVLVATANGYSPAHFSVQAGTRVRLIFRAFGEALCASELVFQTGPGQTQALYLASGKDKQVLEFTPDQPGDYGFHCAHEIYFGVMTVRAADPASS